MPKRTKHRKQQRGVLREKATSGNYVAFGDYGLQSLESAWVTARQLEAGRVACTHFLQREGKLFIRVFPDKPVSKKPLETRMGKGKAETDYWAARVSSGTILFEIAGVPFESAQGALKRVAMKMPVRCRLVKRRLTV
jgi:large subunit ribosomal protein L16